jgi:hypothetical protein
MNSICAALFTGLSRLSAAALFVTLVCTTAMRADEQPPEDEQWKWDGYESEVGHDRFSAAYRDSLMADRGVGDNRGMGDPVTVPYGRERLVFDGGWGFLRAGWALIIFEKEPGDSATVNVIGKVFTNSFVSTFYKVRDYVHAYCDARSLYPLFFEQHIQEGRYSDERWTIFDHANGKVYYKSKKGEIESDAEAGIQNYMSLLYVLRAMDFAVGDTFSIRTFYHSKDFPVRFDVHRKEITTVPAGTFECFVLEPRLVGEGRGFTKRDKLSIWLTDDEYRMPVLVKAKINIGSLSARLLHYERE